MVAYPGIFQLLALYITKYGSQPYLAADTNCQEANRALENSVCDTKECNEIATKILAGMNSTVDPCEDFYAYMCGTWPVHNSIPPDDNKWSELRKLSGKINERIKEILEEPAMADDVLPVRLAKAWYRSCMDLDKLEERGIRPIREMLDELGGWPLISENWDSAIKWQDVHDNYRRLYDVHTFYNIHVQPHFVNSSKLMITLQLDVSYPLYSTLGAVDEDVIWLVSSYIDAITKIAQALVQETGANVSSERIMKDAFAVFLMIFELQTIVPETGPNMKYYEWMTISDLQMWYDKSTRHNSSNAVNWLKVIRNTFEAADVSIDENTVIQVVGKAALRALAQLIDGMSPRTIVDYIHWNAITKFMSYTNGMMRHLLFRSKNFYLRQEREESRWKTCIADMKLKEVISYAYVKKYFSKSTKNIALSIVNEILREMGSTISESNWLPSDMKIFMVQKLKNIVRLIGYPAWYDNRTAVANFYNDFTVGPDYFDNVVNFIRYQIRKGSHELKKPFDKYRWFQQPTSTNAYYYPQANSIIIPAALLQDGSLGNSIPLSVGYGRIGFLAAHEFVHAVTGQGLHYDKSGHYLENSEGETNDKYREKNRCYIDQFSQYILTNATENGAPIFIDGNLTNAENKADSIALGLVYKAYRKRVGSKCGYSSKLRGLELYTDDQLFFMSFASGLCESTRPEYQQLTYNLDIHSPWNYRVIGALSNVEAFATAFKCPPNSNMNPVKKCTFW
ncbi:hypothetical protein KM043_008886 [Ampulex compressa]|nr:hypothetical protein KM043_008886 [Ampulex compressa]